MNNYPDFDDLEAKIEAKNILKTFIQTENEAEAIKAKINR
jgi:hypothetical protein